MLSYLSNSAHPEIQMAVHQTARFSLVLFTRLTNLKVLNCTLMRIMLVDGVLQTQKKQTIFFQELV